MGTPYLAEIRLFSFTYPPKGWALCDGQLLPINQNQALFSILGATYGGDGRVNFALPDLRGRAPLHADGTVALGARAGSESVTLVTAQLPAHDHTLSASSDVAVATSPAANALAKKPRFGANVYAAPAAPAPLHLLSIGTVGGSQPHENMQPFLVLSFAIALVGVFPSRN